MNGYTIFFAEIRQQPTLDDRSAVVPGVGVGIRFQLVGEERPLAMANFAGRPFFTDVIDEIGCAGIKRAVVYFENLSNTFLKKMIDNYQ